MAALAGDIVKAIGEKVASQIFDELSKAILGDDFAKIANRFNDVITAIASSERRVMNQVDYIAAESRYREMVDQIRSWTDSLAKYTKERADTKNPTAKNYDHLREDLWNNRDNAGGITSTLNSIHYVLESPTGLLVRYEKILRTEAATDDDNTDIIHYYLKGMDNLLAGAFSIQLYGLALQIFMCSCSTQKDFDTQGFQNDMWAKFTMQKSAAFKALHPFVRMLKRSYDGDIEQWRLWSIDTNDGKRLYCDGAKDIRIANVGTDGESMWRLLFYDGDKVFVSTASERNMRVQRYSWSATQHSFSYGKGHFLVCNGGGYGGGMHPKVYKDPLYDLRTKIALTNDNGKDARFRFVKPKDLRSDDEAHWLWEQTFTLSRRDVPSHLNAPPPESDK